jgi:hypothetical protein
MIKIIHRLRFQFNRSVAVDHSLEPLSSSDVLRATSLAQTMSSQTHKYESIVVIGTRSGVRQRISEYNPHEPPFQALEHKSQVSR